MSSNIVVATIWSFLQRSGSLLVSFCSNMVLARLLCPDDFGIMAIIMVFVSIADVIVDGGLGNALIQKSNLRSSDINTVFTSNICISLFFYLIIFILSPFISEITEVSDLALYLRIQAICIIIKGLYVVDFSIMNRDMRFKELAIIGLICNIITTALAISLAALDYGLWSLIIRNIVLDISLMIIYFVYSGVKVKISFSKQSFRELFGFGFFVAISNIIETIYSNILTFLIGRRYSVTDLGYYHQAYSLHQIPVYSISSVINQVFFPYFSKIQDSIATLRLTFQRTILLVTFFVFPLLSYLFFFGGPVIILLYSEKWLESIPLFQILCFAGFFNAILHLCRSTMKALGMTRLLFYSQLSSSLVGILLILMFLSFPINKFVIVVVVYSVISYIIVGYYVGKRIEFGLYRQFLTFLPNAIIGLFSGSVVFYIFSRFCTRLNDISIVILSFILFVIIYLLTHFISSTKSFSEISNYFHKNNGYNDKGYSK